MNYIAEIKAFHDLVQIKQLSTGQIALWYALMYINNKCAWTEWFTVPNMTIELNSGLSKSGIYKARNVLKQYGVIDFKPNGTKATSYKLFSLSNTTLNDTARLNSNQDSNRNGNQDSNQDSNRNGNPLNKLNETKLYKEIDKEKISKEEVDNKKNKYAEFVSMSGDEYGKLIEKHGEILTNRMIEILDNYKGSKGKTYKSDYRAILSWVEDKVLKDSNIPTQSNQGDPSNSSWRGSDKRL